MPDAAPGAAPHRVVLLDGATAAHLTQLTFPAYRWLMPNAGPDGPIFAFAMTPADSRRVIGVGLARREGDAADLLSLVLMPKQRGQGLAGRLLAVIEETLAKKGVKEMGAVFDVRRASGAKTAHLLEKRGWGAPELRFLSFKSDFAHAIEAPWMRARATPAGTALVPWAAVAGDYRGRIADPTAVTPDLDPARYVPHAHDGAPLEPAGSFALLEGEHLVGWVLCHRIHAHDARITASYIHPRLAQRFASGPLWRAAILGLRDAGYKYAIWVASAAHPGYIEFARRHIAPIAISVSEMVRMTNRLESA